MPKVNANGVTINYERQGSGEPLVLIPYLAADNACYAFQVADYAKHFTCFSLDEAQPCRTGLFDLLIDQLLEQGLSVERPETPLREQFVFWVVSHATLSSPRTAGSLLMTSPTELISRMISFAIW